MDIVWANYNEVLNVICSQLSEASFVSIDCEFTGLRLADKTDRADTYLRETSGPDGEDEDKINDERVNSAARKVITAADQVANIQSRYSDYRLAAEAFQIIQVGVCIVLADQDVGEYVMLPYNFYVSPILPLKFGIDRRFLFQMSAAAFHLSHRFDFNKWLANGIPYLNRNEQTEIEERQLQFISQEFEDINIDQSGQKLLDSVLPGLNAWANDPNPEESWFNISVSNSYQKRIIYQTIRNSYPQLYAVGRRDFMQIRRKDKDATEHTKRSEKYDKLMSEVNQYVGIRHIFDHISRSKIPVVGHNIFVDLINIYAKFVGTLPSSVEEFAHQINSLFPTVIDTKYFGTMGDMTDTDAQHSSLREMLGNLRSVVYPVYTIHPEFTKYDNRDYMHEAGWDAWETAKLFLKQGGKYFYLDTDRSFPNSSGNFEEGDEQADRDVMMISDDATTYSRKRHEPLLHEPASMDDKIMRFAPPRPERGIRWLAESVRSEEQNWDGRDSSYQVDTADEWRVDQNVNGNAWGRFEVAPLFESASVHDEDRVMADTDTAEAAAPPLANHIGIMNPILPEFSSPVWGTIANRLRVTGTVERVLVLK
ncbi:ribonuclease H-like domain-containing protein [Lipomyces kononenkoae]|uniref:Ribonuclease H-like domain-containing protein n=1 Tax=Lipomyces kononenkoae TaxID=34357 RepID=A0ACC3SU85_LIPKO